MANIWLGPVLLAFGVLPFLAAVMHMQAEPRDRMPTGHNATAIAMPGCFCFVSLRSVAV